MGNTFEKEIGERIRRIRESKSPKMTQADLAELAGLSAVTISNIETGKIPKVAARHIHQISKALGVPVSFLYGENKELLDAIEKLSGLAKETFEKATELNKTSAEKIKKSKQSA